MVLASICLGASFQDMKNKLSSLWHVMLSCCNPCSCIPVILVCAATGTLYPRDGQISKEQGKLVAKFGPLESWSIVGKADSYQVLLEPQTCHHGRRLSGPPGKAQPFAT